MGILGNRIAAKRRVRASDVVIELPEDCCNITEDVEPTKPDKSYDPSDERVRLWNKFALRSQSDKRLTTLYLWLTEAFCSQRWQDRPFKVLHVDMLKTEDDTLLVRFNIYSETRVYHIQAHLRPPDKYDDYLGATYTTRKDDPGEDWNRGADLSDGEFSRDTFNKIVGDFLSLEVLPHLDPDVYPAGASNAPTTFVPTMKAGDVEYVGIVPLIEKTKNGITEVLAKRNIVSGLLPKNTEHINNDETKELHKKWGVSFAKDKDGYFCYTHRARSKSYPTIGDIPKSALKFIDSTGMKASARDDLIRPLPAARPKPVCPQCGSNETRWREFGADTEYNGMELFCPHCVKSWEEDELPRIKETAAAKSSKPLHIFDFDGTLVDTGEFNQDRIDNPKPIRKNLDRFKALIADDADVIVMTARSNAGLVRRTLEDLGVEMVGIRIIALGDPEETAKGEYIAKNLASRYETITLYDDRQDYLDAAEEAMKDKGASFKAVKAALVSDAEYLAAVERGDMDTAQRMVDEAANAAGYTVGPVYHGTNSKFNVFKPQFGKAIWFSEDKDKIARGDSGASGTQRIVPVFLKATNPAGWKEYDKLLEMQIISNGFDSVHLDDDWIVYSPSQIKSAEPVVYNNFGKVVPLSKRFNSSSNDIRARRNMTVTTKKYQVTYADGTCGFRNMTPNHAESVKSRDGVAAVSLMDLPDEKVEAENKNKGEYDLWGSIEKAVERGLLAYVGFMAADYLHQKKNASFGLENYRPVIDAYGEIGHNEKLTDDDKSVILKRLNDAGWDASDEGIEFLWDEILRHRQATA